MANPTDPTGRSGERGESAQLALPILGAPSFDKTVELGALTRGPRGLLSLLHLEDNEANVTIAEGVVFDCVRRGLGGRTSLGPTETISPTFAEGLRQRMQIKAAYKATVEENVPLGIVSPDETTLTELPHISPRFDLLEGRLPLVRERFVAVEAFQAGLFQLPHMQYQADMLRPLAAERINDPAILPEQETLLANNKLFANLIILVGLQRGASLFAQPTDIVDAAELWSDNDRRVAIEQRIIAFMGNSAERLGILREHITSYTQAVLAEIDIFFAGHAKGFTESDLQESPFLVTAPEQATIRREFDEADIEQARSTFDTLMTTTSQRRGGRKGLVSLEDVQDISPLNLYFLYQHLTTTNEKFDFTGLKAGVPLTTYIALLDILQAQQYRERGTGQEIPEFEPQVRERVYDTVKFHVIDSIIRTDGISHASTVSTLASLPFPVLYEYLGIHHEYDDAIYGFGDNVWAQIARSAGIVIDAVGDLYFPPGIEAAFRSYFEDMPAEMRERVKQQLSVTID